MKLARTISALAVAGALAAGGAALSGCGASATLDPIARAAEVTSRQSGVRLTLTMQLTSPALAAAAAGSGGGLGAGSFTIVANGSFDELHRSGEMTMDLSQIPGISTLSGGNAQVRMVFLYPTIYMNMPFLAGKLPEGKTWMKLDLAKAGKAAGLSQLSSVDQTDPTQFLNYLRGSSGSVVTVGPETVNGVVATHYRATLQLSRILDRLPSGDQAAAKAALEKLGAAGSGSPGGGIPVDVWVDASGRVRRMQMAFNGLGGAGGSGAAAAPGGAAGVAAGVSASITIDFKHYGPVPPVSPPPSGEVFDASAMVAHGLGGQ